MTSIQQNKTDLINQKRQMLKTHPTEFVWLSLISNVYKMSGRSVSVYTDTSASHEYLCTLIYTDTNFVNYLSNDLKQTCFQITFKK